MSKILYHVHFKKYQCSKNLVSTQKQCLGIYKMYALCDFTAESSLQKVAVV